MKHCDRATEFRNIYKGTDIFKFWLAVSYSCHRNKTGHRQDNSPTVFMEIDSHIHLGVFLSNNCAWHSHIDHVKVNIWGRIDLYHERVEVLSR